MNDEQESDSYRLIAWILGIAVTIAIATAVVPAILMATDAANPVPGAATSSAPTSSAAPVSPAAPVAPAASAAGSAIPAPVKLYFASGKVTVGSDGADKLTGIVAAVKAGAANKAMVSGFHDKTGDAVQNAELSKNRAMAVRDELMKAGLSEAQVELRKPQESDSSGSDQEARRVEVTAVR
jgi:outer membrane protein OmpA-like peptidoglycan-associated protein